MRQSEQQRSFLAQRRLRIGSFKNVSQWNGIVAGKFNRAQDADRTDKIDRCSLSLVRRNVEAVL